MELYEVTYIPKGESEENYILVRAISLTSAITKVLKEKIGVEEQSVRRISVARPSADYLD